jgi:hypothetical protein
MPVPGLKVFLKALPINFFAFSAAFGTLSPFASSEASAAEKVQPVP